MNDTNDEKLQVTVRRLPREITPTRDLWPSIATRIGHKHRARPVWAYGLAASVFVALGAAGAWYALHSTVPTPTTLVAENAPSAVADPDAAYFAARAAYAENSVLNARNLSPATRKVILKNLQIIESSMNEIRQALEKDPNNSALRSLLFTLYQDEAKLLASTQQIQTKPDPRNDI